MIVKAFNTLFSHVLAAGSFQGRPLDVFIEGDDAQAKARFAAFIESLGLRPMDIGLAAHGADAGARLPAVAGPARPRHQAHQLFNRGQPSRPSPPVAPFFHLTYEEQQHARFRYWRNRPYRFVHHP